MIVAVANEYFASQVTCVLLCHKCYNDNSLVHAGHGTGHRALHDLMEASQYPYEVRAEIDLGRTDCGGEFAWVLANETLKLKSCWLHNKSFPHHHYCTSFPDEETETTKAM